MIFTTATGKTRRADARVRQLSKGQTSTAGITNDELIVVVGLLDRRVAIRRRLPAGANCRVELLTLRLRRVRQSLLHRRLCVGGARSVPCGVSTNSAGAEAGAAAGAVYFLKRILRRSREIDLRCRLLMERRDATFATGSSEGKGRAVPAAAGLRRRIVATSRTGRRGVDDLAAEKPYRRTKVTVEFRVRLLVEPAEGGMSIEP